MTRADAFLSFAVLALAACTGGDDFPTGEPPPYQPGNHVVSSSTDLIAYDSCAALEADLETLAIERSGKTSAQLEAGEYEPPKDGGKPTIDLFDRPRAAPAPDRGLPEAFNGSEAYLIRQGHLLALSATDAQQLSAPPIQGDPWNLFVDGDRALVVTSLEVDGLPATHPLTAIFGVQREEDYHFVPDVVTKLTVLDISDPTRPTTLRETFIEGELVASARSGSVVQLVNFELHESPDELVVADYFDEADPEASRERVVADIRAMTLGDFLPRIVDREGDGDYTARPIDETACRTVSRAKDSHGDGQISLLSIDLADPSLVLHEQQIIGNAPQVALADDRLALYTGSHASWWYFWFADDPRQLDVFLFGGGEHRATTRLEQVDFTWPRIGVAGDVVRLLEHGSLVLYGKAGNALEELSRVDDLGENGLVHDLGGDRALVSDDEVLHIVNLVDQNAPTETRVTFSANAIYVEPLGERLLVFLSPATVALVELDGEPGVVDELSLGDLEPNGLFRGIGLTVADDGGQLALRGRAHVGELDENGETHPVFAEIAQLVGIEDDNNLVLRGTVDHNDFSEDFARASDVRRAFFAGDRLLVLGSEGVTLHELPELTRVAASPFEVPDVSLPTWWD